VGGPRRQVTVGFAASREVGGGERVLADARHAIEEMHRRYPVGRAEVEPRVFVRAPTIGSSWPHGSSPPCASTSPTPRND